MFQTVICIIWANRSSFHSFRTRIESSIHPFFLYKQKIFSLYAYFELFPYAIWVIKLLHMPYGTPPNRASLVLCIFSKALLDRHTESIMGKSTSIWCPDFCWVPCPLCVCYFRSIIVDLLKRVSRLLLGKVSILVFGILSKTLWDIIFSQICAKLLQRVFRLMSGYIVLYAFGTLSIALLGILLIK